MLPLKARLFSGAFASAPLQHLFRKKLGFILAQKTFAHLSHGFLRFACLPIFAVIRLRRESLNGEEYAFSRLFHAALSLFVYHSLYSGLLLTFCVFYLLGAISIFLMGTTSYQAVRIWYYAMCDTTVFDAVTSFQLKCTLIISIKIKAVFQDRIHMKR